MPPVVESSGLILVIFLTQQFVFLKNLNNQMNDQDFGFQYQLNFYLKKFYFSIVTYQHAKQYNYQVLDLIFLHFFL